MADQLEGKALSDAVAVAMGWVPPNGMSDAMAGHWRRWWANVPDYLDPSTDEEKWAWLADKAYGAKVVAHASMIHGDMVFGAEVELVARRDRMLCTSRATGATLSEALCRLILAVKEAGRG